MAQRSSRRFSVLALLLLLLAPPGAGFSAGPEVRVVASGLDNPRGLGIGHGGTVYVAEAGVGGAGPCMPGPEGDEVCYGESGAVTVITRHGQRRLVEGLPSLAAAGGVGAEGPEDVVGGWRSVYVLLGLGADPAARDLLPPRGELLGQLLRVDKRNGSWRPFADVAAFEALADPDAGMPGTSVDSNPVSVIRTWRGFSVADAGGNSLLDVDWRGRVSLRAVFAVRIVPAPPPLPFPTIPMQSVPTSVTVGPRGNLWVGELTGFPFPEGAARILRVGRKGRPPEVALDGFTHVLDLVFDRNGDLYVLQISTTSLLLRELTGALIRVSPDGTRQELIPGRLFAPTGLALDRSRRTLYVSNCGVCPGTGEVLALDLPRAERDDDDDEDEDRDD